MKVGDLVRIKAKFLYPEDYNSMFGIVIKLVDEFCDVIVYWSDGETAWVQEDNIEVINESR